MTVDDRLNRGGLSCRCNRLADIRPIQRQRNGRNASRSSRVGKRLVCIQRALPGIALHIDCGTANPEGILATGPRIWVRRRDIVLQEVIPRKSELKQLSVAPAQ